MASNKSGLKSHGIMWGFILNKDHGGNSRNFTRINHALSN
jgi:hypothetical protein